MVPALESSLIGNTFTVVRFENSLEIPVFLKAGGTRFFNSKEKLQHAVEDRRRHALYG